MGDPLTDRRVQAALHEQPFPLLFLTVSGAHLYGFPSADSDYDLRGCHVLPLDDMLGLWEPRKTVEYMDQDRVLDIVTHDVAKYFSLLLKRNGYVLEQVYSPLVLVTTPEHEELKETARLTLTRYHFHHYLGFARNELKLVHRHPERRVKRLLYLYRVYLTGIHLMRTGEINANLPSLLEQLRGSPQFRELVDRADYLMDRKMLGYEGISMSDEEVQPYLEDAATLAEVLVEAGEQSTLPEEPTAKPALNDLLLRVRHKYAEGLAAGA